jgi:hypothetical protein
MDIGADDAAVYRYQYNHAVPGRGPRIQEALAAFKGKINLKNNMHWQIALNYIFKIHTKNMGVIMTCTLFGFFLLNTYLMMA